MNRYHVNWLTWCAMAGAAALLVLLFGCAGTVKPETIRQQIAYTEGTLTATYTTIRDLRTSGRLSSEKRNELVRQADLVGTGLDAARTALGEGKADTALDKLRLAKAALTALQSILEAYK